MLVETERTHLESQTNKIWILGYGAFAPRRLPAGLANQMARVRVIYTIIREPKGVWLPVELVDKEVVRLNRHFTNMDDRKDNYKRIADDVISAALKENGDVAYVCYGSPVVFDRVVGLIRLLAAEAGIQTVVVPATSSVDACLAFIGEDMAPGLQICEARWLVQNEVMLDQKLGALLFQVGVFDTDGVMRDGELNVAKLIELRTYLLKFYPRDHYCIFVRAPFFVGDAGYFNGRALKDLDVGVAEDLMDTSLYVPPISDVDRESKHWWLRLRK